MIDTQSLSTLPIPSHTTPLYLHNDARHGVCWGLPSGERGWAAGNHATLLSDLHLLYYPHVLGSEGNAALVHQLWWRGNRHVRVGSPLAAENVTDPAGVLQRMRQFDRLPSQGGYRPLTADDLVSYQLILASDMPDVQVELLKTHPAWSGLSFFTNLNKPAVARLLALIIDPRWYIEPTQPDHQRKIFSYLGLVPSADCGYANMEAVLRGTKYGGRHGDRAQLVVQAWLPPAAENPPAGELPTDYFLRHCFRCGGGAKGLLQASRRFIRFLCGVWQEEMRRIRKENGALAQLEPAFVPEHFFGEFGAGEEATISAYRQHYHGFS